MVHEGGARQVSLEPFFVFRLFIVIVVDCGAEEANKFRKCNDGSGEIVVVVVARSTTIISKNKTLLMKVLKWW